MKVLLRRLTTAWAALAVVVLMMPLATGCSSARPGKPQTLPEPQRGSQPETTTLPSPRRSSGQTDHGEQKARTSAERVAARARSLLTRPYRGGGATPSGFDCSGFTKYVFTSAGIDLPRTTVQQATVGSWLPADELRVGDLVFFGVDRARPFHVGLVVSEPGRPLTMIHASTSRGVIETEIVSNSYWLTRLQYGRRAID
jgi:cell wall-associated NlpC family hydrolase